MYKIILGYTLIVSYIVLAGKSLMDIKPNDTWISEGHLIQLIEVSFNFSICANVYLSDNSPAIENIFNTFTRIYRYEYLLKNNVYGCTGYFMLFTKIDTLPEVLKSVPTNIADNELLIVVDDEVDESTNVFEAAMYDNANVNVVARNGLWTLSANFLYQRSFKRVFNYDEMRRKRGIVNLQGRELQAATDFNPPLSYMKTTINRTINGVERQFFTANTSDPEFDGIEMKLFLLIAERLNFTWTFRSRNNRYRYGRKNETGWYGGIIGQVAEQEVDIAFSGIWLELPQYAFINLTYPWTQLDVRFLVPRPKPRTSFWALTKPLSPEVWIAVIAVIFLQSIYVFARSWLLPLSPKRYRSFTVTCSEVMARLLGLTVNQRSRTFRLQFQLWHMTGILVVTAYSSSLAANLASSGYDERIDTTKQFIEANLTWGREGVAPSFSSFSNVQNPWTSQFLAHFESERDEEDRHRKIMAGNYAILGRVVGSMFFPENDIREGDLKDYRIMKNNVGQYFTSFGVQSWLLNSCSKVMMWLHASGFVDYHIRDVLRRHTTTAYHELLKEYDSLADRPRVLALTPLGVAFVILAIGLILSTIVFYFELRTAKKNNDSLFRSYELLRKTRSRTNRRNKKSAFRVLNNFL